MSAFLYLHFEETSVVTLNVLGIRIFAPKPVHSVHLITYAVVKCLVSFKCKSALMREI